MKVDELTLGMKPVSGLGAERQEAGGGVFLLEVETTEDLRVAGDELVALVQLLAADDADEAPDVVDAASCTHHQLVGRDWFHAATTPHAVQPTTSQTPLPSST